MFLTACSTADYKKPVGNFSTAANEMETALVELNTLVTNAQQEIVYNRVINAKLLVNFQEGECQSDSERCRLDAKNTNGERETLTPEPALQNILALARSLRTYANNLSAIVEADTAAQVETSVNETIGSLGRIEATVNKIGGKSENAAGKIKEYVTPFGLLINWIVGQYVAEVKIDALQHATKDAKDIVKKATMILQDTEKEAKVVRNRPWAKEASIRNDDYKKDKSEQNLKALLRAAKEYDKFLQARSSNIFARFREAMIPW